MAESVKVIVRCRPMNSRENALKCKNVVTMDSDRCSCSIVNPTDNTAPPKSFTFDGVYGDNSTTEQIYNESAYPLIEGVLEGYNSTVFAYGQTGCGKSFSMQGVTDPGSQRGIIPRAFEHIFEAISVSQDVKYLVLASYLEIYNEEIRDLLGSDVKQKLDLKEVPDKGVYVQDLTWHSVGSVLDCESLMNKGWSNRSVGATLMNADSSRSHSIFSISVEMMSTASSEDAAHAIRRGKLSLVDLAGSERQAKTGAMGERLKEASKINLSLSALGNVISALVDGKAKHIPYRDSKLTRLLQDSLGGNTKTLMLACLSPADNNYDETLSTLRYANRAKNIKNQPQINEDPKDAMLRKYQEEIEQLKEMLTKPRLTAVVDEVLLEQEREKIRLEYEKEMAALKAQFNEVNSSKSQVQEELLSLKNQYDRQLQDIDNQSVFKQAPLKVVESSTGSCQEAQPGKVIENNHKNSNVNNNQDSLDVKEANKATQQEIMARLIKLQRSLVGGERANDQSLKERRARRKRAAEKRLAALAEVLSKQEHHEHSSLLLGVYDDMHDQLTAKGEHLKKHKQKIRAMEREIADLQSEFETERTDYLETIRRLDRQLQLNVQILEKIAPNLKSPSNYSNIETIKADAWWDDDAQKWIIPDFMVLRTKLPPAAGRDGTSGEMAPLQPAEPHKLDPAEDEDFAGNYFKPKRAAELLIKAQQDVARANNYMYGNKVNLQGSLNAINSLSSLKASPPTFLNHSWSGPQTTVNTTMNGWMGKADPSVRKPARLEALPIVDRKPMQRQLNTLDVI